MAEAFLKGLTERHPRNCGFQARSILRMKEHYQSEDIHRAIEHAIRYQAFEARAIERILRAKAIPRTLESIRNERARQELQKALPRITQRPLDQYSELFRKDHDHAGGDPERDQSSIWKTLKLLGIQKVLDQELARAAQQALPPTELVERLLSIESTARIERRIERRIKESRLPERKLLSDFDFGFQTGVDKTQVLEIAKLDFVSRKQGLIIAGNSGTGKSHIAKALLLIGCQHLYRCRYTTAADMLTELMASLADQSFHQKLKQYTSP